MSIEVGSGKRLTLYHGDPLLGWSFSPDGKRVVFAARTGSNPKAFEASNIDLFVTSSEGGDAKQITDSGDNGWRRESITGPLSKEFLLRGCSGLTPVEWSEDGSALLGAWECEFSADPVAVDVDTGKPRRLGAGIAFSLSADGELALVDGGSGAEPSPEARQVLVYPLGGGKPTVVAEAAVGPGWNR